MNDPSKPSRAAQTPIEQLIDKAAMRCTVCGSTAGSCKCWQTCVVCGWSYLRGQECRNPQCTNKRIGDAFGQTVANFVLHRMRELYPEPLKFASGGFRRTLAAVIKKEVSAAVVETYNSCAEHCPHQAKERA